MNSERILEYIKKHSSADDFSLKIYKVDSHETRFAQNRVTQHIAGPKMDITLNVAFGSKCGSATVNQDDDAALAFLLKTAEDIAHLSPEDPEFIPFADPAELPKVNNCDQETKNLDPKKMVEIIQQAIAKAENNQALVSGMTEKHYSEHQMFTRKGFAGSDQQSRFGHSMTIKKGSVETKVDYDAKSFAGFDLEKEFHQLLEQANALADMHSFDPQQIPVILRPGALQELLWYMTWMMQRRQSDEGFTPFTGQLGKPFFGEKFSWYSTLQQPLISAFPFDHEGVPATELAWVEKGLLKNMPTNRYWAQKVGAKPMSAYNMYIPGDGTSEDEMMQLVPRGLIINRFWYIRTVDGKTGELTGMTRDGVLYFENGKVQHAVNNLRFNEIPHDATRRILALGKSVLASSMAMLPTMLIKNFNFVDKTTF